MTFILVKWYNWINETITEGESMKLFLDVVEDKFFLPLTNPSKRLYERVIFSIFEWVEELDEHDENDRQIITEKLIEMLDKRPGTNIYDDTGKEVEGKNKERAQSIIRYLIDSRWIFEESKGDGLYSINFYDHSYKVISMMKEIRENKPKLYQSDLRKILRNLEDINTHDIVSFNDIYDAVESLSNMLKSLRSNINQYYVNIISDSNTEDLKVIAKNLDEYRLEFFDKAYYMFKTEADSNNSIYFITEQIETLYGSSLDKLLDSYKDTISAKLSDEEIIYELEIKVNQMLTSLRGMDTVIKNIEEKNSKYLMSLINKIFYIINRGSDITGLLNQTISHTISNTLKDFSFLNLNDQRHYTVERMFYPQKKREQLDPVFIKTISKLTEEEILEQKKSHAKTFKYSIRNINKYVLQLLGNNNTANATDIVLKDDDDYIKILLIALYGNINETDYYINLTGNKAIIENIKFDNFIIYRKGSNNE